MRETIINCEKYKQSNPDADCSCEECKEGKMARDLLSANKKDI